VSPADGGGAGQILRPYQARAIEQLRAEFRAGRRRVLLVAPTGAGKTSVAAEMIRSAVARGNGVIFLAHRKELIDQCSARLDQFGVEHGVVMADHPRRRPAQRVQVCSIQTLRARPNERPAAQLIIVDEAHRARADEYLKALAHYPDAKVVGLTATPWRADGKGLGEKLFESLVVAELPSRLVAAGFLVKAVGFSYEFPDLSNVETKGKAGDYEEGELGRAMNTSRLVGGIVEKYQQHAGGKRAVVFACTIEHSQSVVAEFRAAGIAAEHIDGKTPKLEREAILRRVASGETLVVSNVGILTEGWDLPAVEVCVLARPTKSVALFLQMIGRVLRPAPGKDRARIHDHTGGLLVHGPPDEDREYTLKGDAPKSRRPVETYACPECECMVTVLDAVCPNCGRQLHDATQRMPELTTEGREVSLDEVREMRSAAQEARFRIAEQARRATREQKAAEYKRLLGIAQRKGYARGWAAHKYRDVFEKWPKFDDELLDSVEPAREPFVPLELVRLATSEAAHEG
jgi:DNA repair protein RadD